MRDCFQIATTGWNISPESFWLMSLRDWYWIFDVRRSDAKQVSILADDELWESIGEVAPYGRKHVSV